MPIRITEDEDGISTWSLSFRGKDEAAESGLNTEGGKIISRNTRGDAVVAAIVGGESAQSEAVSNDVAERSGLRAKVKVIRIRKALEGFIAGLLKGEDGDLLGMGHGHGTEEETVDHAEDAGVDGDAEGKRYDGDGGKPGRLAKCAKRKTQILPEICHPITSHENPSELGAKSYPNRGDWISY